MNSNPLLKLTSQTLLISLALLARMPVAEAQPALGLLPSNNRVLLYWPSSYTNYALQSNTNLVGTNWVDATDAVSTTYGSSLAVTVAKPAVARFFRLFNTNSAGSKPEGMALIPAGNYTMGDTIYSMPDALPTNVYVSAFYMDVNLVSYGQWQTVYFYGTNHGYSFDNRGSGKAANHPVQTVSWCDCVKWCNARSQQAGLTPAYYTDQALTQVYRSGQVTNPYVKWSADGYRLPTEAEWEKAARAGLSGQRFPWGNTISQSQASYYSMPETYSYDLGPSGLNPIFTVGGLPYTSPVGYFPANGYGLYDMAGNVWEFCWDWYGTPYGQPTASNPTGAASGKYRVLRGGGFLSGPPLLHCAYREGKISPTFVNYAYGFRCVRGH